jgi:hypothetical protein
VEFELKARFYFLEPEFIFDKNDKIIKGQNHLSEDGLFDSHFSYLL